MPGLTKPRIPHHIFDAAKVEEILTKEGWKKQAVPMLFPKDTVTFQTNDKLEWWNRGFDFLCVYVLGSQATVLLPVTKARATTAIRRPKP